jgi:hypothetical protein
MIQTNETLPLAEAKAQLSRLVDRVEKTDEEVGPRRTVYEEAVRLIRRERRP